MHLSLSLPARRAAFAAIVCTIVALGCTQNDSASKATPADTTAKQAATATPAAPTAAAAQAPDSFLVALTTTRGRVVIAIHRSWAPLGTDRFYQLVSSGFFDDAGFFRVMPGFIVQFGLPADPTKNQQWSAAIKDDPAAGHSNLKGTVTFATAGPGTRTTQMFINLGDNPGLDSQGFVPLGSVTEGLPIVTTINSEYGEKPDQGAITAQGNAYLKKTFPKLDYIQTAKVEKEWR